MKSLGKLSDIEALAEIFSPAGKKWLDIGCGDGALACRLAELGATVIGVEPDPVQAEKNNVLELPPNVTLVQGQAQSLPVDDRAMDVVIFSYSLHHVPQPDMAVALGEARRVLAVDGVLCVVEPVAEGPYHRAIELFHDETKVRTAAMEALAAHAQPYFSDENIYTYSTINRYLSFSEFTNYMLGLTYNNYDAEIVIGDAVRERFEACKDGDEYVLEQPMRINMFSSQLAE